MKVRLGFEKQPQAVQKPDGPSAGGKSFSDFLEDSRNTRAGDNRGGTQSVGFLDRFQSDWNKAQIQRQGFIESLPSSYSAYLKSQMLVSDLALKSNLMSKIGEGVSSSIRRVQNFGS
jgi:hypothetical protein